MSYLKKMLLISAGAMHLLLTALPGHSQEPNSYALGIQAEMSGSYVQAVENYKVSADKGLSDAKYALGRLYRDVYNDDKTSFDWFLQAAKQGHVFSQYEVGLIYVSGNSAANADLHEAKLWLSSAANHGHGEAAYLLYDLSSDDSEKLKWLKIAAEQGVVEAMQRLSEAYAHGELGLTVDVQAVHQWNQRARLARE